MSVLKTGDKVRHYEVEHGWMFGTVLAIFDKDFAGATLSTAAVAFDAYQPDSWRGYHAQQRDIACFLLEKLEN